MFVYETLFFVPFKSFYIEEKNKRNRSDCKKIKMNVILGIKTP